MQLPVGDNSTALQTEVERRSKRRKRQQRKEERQPKEGHTSRYIPDLQPIAPSGTPLLEPIGRDPGHSLSGSLAAEHASMMISYVLYMHLTHTSEGGLQRGQRSTTYMDLRLRLMPARSPIDSASADDRHDACGTRWHLFLL